jgi:hypothetical protein
MFLRNIRNWIFTNISFLIKNDFIAVALGFCIGRQKNYSTNIFKIKSKAKELDVDFIARKTAFA